MLALLEYTAEMEKRGSALPDLYEIDSDRQLRSLLHFVSRIFAVDCRLIVHQATAARSKKTGAWSLIIGRLARTCYPRCYPNRPRNLTSMGLCL